MSSTRPPQPTDLAGIAAALPAAWKSTVLGRVGNANVKVLRMDSGPHPEERRLSREGWPTMDEQVHIRPYQPADWSAVWSMLAPVFRAGETYAVERDISEAAAQRYWTDASRAVLVAEDPSTGQLLGTYYVRPNQQGPGSHVCNGGYIVAESARGRGVASRMCEHSQREALARGFRAMQYNLVVASNDGAVRLWKAMGFTIVGTLPGAFRHPTLGFVDAYVMYKQLAAGFGSQAEGRL